MNKKNLRYSRRPVALREEEDRYGNIAEISRLYAKIVTAADEMESMAENSGNYAAVSGIVKEHADNIRKEAEKLRKFLFLVTKGRFRMSFDESAKSGYYRSRLNEARNDNGGLRNSELYGFLKNKVSKTIIDTLKANGLDAELVNKDDEKIKDIEIKIKKDKLEGMNVLYVNSYNGCNEEGIGIVPIANAKFTNARRPTQGFVFVSPDDNCVYIIPSLVLQRNWTKLLADKRNDAVRIVLDALGVSNQISMCDVDRLRELAASDGKILVMPKAVADEYHKQLDIYLEIEAKK